MRVRSGRHGPPDLFNGGVELRCRGQCLVNLGVQAVLDAGGLPIPNKTHATDVVNAALEIQQFMLQHLRQRTEENKELFEIRIGVHTGPVVAGIVGIKKWQYDIWGDTVNTAARMQQNGEPGKINISGTTRELIKHRFNCEYRGRIDAKHKGLIDMYFVDGKK